MLHGCHVTAMRHQSAYTDMHATTLGGWHNQTRVHATIEIKLSESTEYFYRIWNLQRQQVPGVIWLSGLASLSLASGLEFQGRIRVNSFEAGLGGPR